MPELSLSDTRLSTWEERDRAHVELINAKNDATIIEWWDDQVGEAIQDGFLNPRKMHESAYDYAVHIGLIRRPGARENPRRGPQPAWRQPIPWRIVSSDQMHPSERPKDGSTVWYAYGRRPSDRSSEYHGPFKTKGEAEAFANSQPAVRPSVSFVRENPVEARDRIQQRETVDYHGENIRLEKYLMDDGTTWWSAIVRGGHWGATTRGEALRQAKSGVDRLLRENPVQARDFQRGDDVQLAPGVLPRLAKKLNPGVVISVEGEKITVLWRDGSKGKMKSEHLILHSGPETPPLLPPESGPREARDFNNIDDALRHEAHRGMFSATHFVKYWDDKKKWVVRTYTPRDDGSYTERELFYKKGLYHWPNTGKRVRKLPSNAEALSKLDPQRGVPGGISREANECGCEHGCGGAAEGRERKVVTVEIAYDEVRQEWEAVARDRHGYSINIIRGESEDQVRASARQHWPHAKHVGENPVEVTDGIPFVKVERNADDFREIREVAQQIGPIKNSRDIYNMMHPWASKQDKEHLCAILLDIHSDLRGVAIVHVGQRDRVAVDPADVLKPAIDRGAKGLAILHNHPSGGADFSDADADLTKAMKNACKASGIAFIDHVVMGEGEFYSFADKKLHKVRSR